MKKENWHKDFDTLFIRDDGLLEDKYEGDAIKAFIAELIEETSIELIWGMVEGVETMKYDNPDDIIIIGAINAILKDVQSMLRKSLDELKGEK